MGAGKHAARRLRFSDRAETRRRLGADFDLAPRVLEPRAGEVATVGRPGIRPSERWSGPRMAAEAKIAGADLPIDPLSRICVRLRWRRAWLRKKAERETAGCDKPRYGFPH